MLIHAANAKTRSFLQNFEKSRSKATAVLTLPQAIHVWLASAGAKGSGKASRDTRDNLETIMEQVNAIPLRMESKGEQLFHYLIRAESTKPNRFSEHRLPSPPRTTRAPDKITSMK